MSDVVNHSIKILRCIGDGVITTDVKGRITYMNPVAERLTGIFIQEAEGEKFPDLVKLKRDDDGNTVLDDQQEELTSGHVAVLYARDGQQYSVSYSMTALKDDDKRVIGYVIVLHDLTNEFDLGKKLKWQMLHDNLTRTKNRHAFELRIQNILDGRYKEDEHSLVYLDIDHFKLVNDAGGSGAGDHILKRISALLNEQLRPGDLLCRVGGDEFAAILRGCKLKQAEEIGNRLRTSIANTSFDWEDKTYHITVSAGLVSVSDPLNSIKDVMICVDQCCSIAREQGGNYLHVYNANDNILERRNNELASLHELQKALEFESFTLSWQIIKPASTDAKYDLMYEFLVRLKVSKGKTAMPDSFIPVAERYGLMNKLDRWVIRQAFSVIASRVEDERVLYNINLSGQTLGDKQTLPFIKKQLVLSKINPEKVCFEITETAVVNSFNVAKDLIKELRAIGCKFALDDFGTGLSSFAYLKHFKVDLIKIDGEFVRHVNTDRIDQAMVHSVQIVASDLGINTIAERVEDQATMDRLKEMGIEYFQGFHIGRPEELNLDKPEDEPFRFAIQK